ncbi:MAG: ribose 5-phosphate isomerase B [Anaerolineales bacterium]|nr:ribose 5-phosphate isomerase B [Anaerolineales bacterium]
MKVAVGSDHAGFPLKPIVVDELQSIGVEVTDKGTYSLDRVDFPDFAALVGRAIQNGEVDRGILICGSGVGVCIAANKMHGIRASVTHDTYSAHQGVEHDGMNVMCLGSRIIGEEVARELVRSFIGAEFQAEDRFINRVNKIAALEAER